MISRPKFSCGFALVLILPSSQMSVAGSCATWHQQVAIAPERVLAEQLDLSLRAAQHAGLRREHLRALLGTRIGGELAVGGGEVVVPEHRHLFLQRTPRVDHAEHPALARVVDVDVGREQIVRGHLHVVRPADALVHVVGPALVLDEMRHRRRRRHVAERLHVRRAGAEAGAAQQVIDVGIQLRHGQSAMVTTPSAKLVRVAPQRRHRRPPHHLAGCGCSATRGTGTRSCRRRRR